MGCNIMSVQTVCEVIVTEVGDEICVTITEIEKQFHDPQDDEPPFFENEYLPAVRIDKDAELAAFKIQESARAFAETTMQAFTR